MLRWISILELSLAFCFTNVARANPVVDAFLQLKPLNPEERASTWRAVSFIPLFHKLFPTFHPQGIKMIGKNLYLSTVQGHDTGFGHLIKYLLDSSQRPRVARAIDRITFSPGPEHRLNHAGGVDGDEDRLFLPLAGYRREGPAKIMQVNLRTFQPHSIARVRDHVGTLVYGKDERQFELFDWGAGLYSVPFADLNFRSEGNIEAAKAEQDPEWEYQDCKGVGDGYAICSAKSSGFLPEGEIHLLRFVKKILPGKKAGSSIQVVHRVPVPNMQSDGRPGGMRPLTYNAMDFSLVYSAENPEFVTGMRFYFVPHDDEDSRLMTFEAAFSPGRPVSRLAKTAIPATRDTKE
jgi:hypothetical protein